MATNSNQTKKNPNNPINRKPSLEERKNRTGTFDSISESLNISNKVPVPSTTTRPPDRK